MTGRAAVRPVKALYGEWARRIAVRPQPSVHRLGGLVPDQTTLAPVIVAESTVPIGLAGRIATWIVPGG